MSQDVSKDYREPMLTTDDGTFRVSGWNSSGDASIMLEDLARGKIINPSDMALTSNQYDDWQWLGTGVNPPGAVAPAVLTEVAADEWHYVFVNNTIKAFPNQQLTHRYAEGSDVMPHLHFAPTTSERYTGTWTAVFTLWLSAAPGTVKSAPITRTIAFDKVMAAGTLETTAFNDVIPGAGRKISSCGTITLKLAMTAGTGLYVVGFDGHHETERLGSRQEWIK